MCDIRHLICLALFVLCCCAEGSVLYGLESVWINPPANETVPVAFVKFENQSSEILLQWEFEEGTFLIGSAFDTDLQVYYFGYVTLNHSRPIFSSFLSAINVTSQEFVFEGVEFPHGVVQWDFDIDSNGELHYPSISPHSVCHAAVCLVNVNRWDPMNQQSSIVLNHIAAITKLSSVAYDERNKQMQIATHGIVTGTPDALVTLSENYYLSSIPSQDGINTQGSIIYNKSTGKSYMVQTFIDGTANIVQFVEGTNDYPVVCALKTPSTGFKYRYSLTDAAAISMEDNIMSLCINKFTAGEAQETRVIVSIQLDTCEQSEIVLNLGRVYNMGGLEYNR